jgi:hypothetical protein
MENNSFENQQASDSTLGAQQPVESVAKSPRSAWIIGAVITVLGTVLLMQNTGTLPQNLGNWWALFLMIPAIAGLGEAVSELQTSGSLSKKGRAGLIFGVVLTMITATFIFNLNEKIYGPIILMCAGLGILFNNYTKK